MNFCGVLTLRGLGMKTMLVSVLRFGKGWIVAQLYRIREFMMLIFLFIPA